VLEVEQAVALLKENFHKQEQTELVALENSYGRVTAEDILAPMDIPNFSKAAMDGFAVKAEETVDCPAKLQVAATTYAGDPPEDAVKKTSSCVRIMTGAQIPAGFNAVVKKENTKTIEEDQIEVLSPVQKGENYICRGGDLKANQVVIPSHTKIDSEQIGTLATLGLTQIKVLKKLRVGLVATGNELASPGEALQAGKIYNSTVYTLASYIERFNAIVVFQEHCPDEVTSFVELLNQYENQVDLIITTGGVSVGDKDFIPQAIETLQAKKIFHYVKMKPGTPMMASIWKDSLILSLSGNPPAATINFHLFYWPLLSYFYSTPEFLLKMAEARLAQDLSKRNKLTRYIRGTVKDGVVSLPKKDGHYAHGMYNCIVIQPANQTISLEDKVKIYFLPM